MQPINIKSIFAGKIILFFRSFKSIKGEIDFFSMNTNMNSDIVDAIERGIIIYKFRSNESKNVIANRNVLIAPVREMAPLKSKELSGFVIEVLLSVTESCL